MKHKLEDRTFTAVLLLCMAATNGCGEASPRDRILKTSGLDVGKVTRCAGTFETQFQLQNLTNLPVSITAVETSCGCTTVANQSFRIEPKGRVSVPLRITFRPSRDQLQKPAWDFSSQVEVFYHSGGQSGSIASAVTAKVIQPISFEAPNFSAKVSAEAFRNSTWDTLGFTTSLPCADLTARIVDIPACPFSASLHEGAAGRGEVRIGHNGESCLQSGRYAGGIIISRGKGLRAEDIAWIPVSVTVDGRCSVAPRVVVFPALAVGETAQQSVRVTGPTGEDIEVQVCSLSDSDDSHQLKVNRKIEPNEAELVATGCRTTTGSQASRYLLQIQGESGWSEQAVIRVISICRDRKDGV